MNQLTRQTLVYKSETVEEAELLVQDTKAKHNVVKYSITEKTKKEKKVVVEIYYITTIVIDYDTEVE